MPLHALPRVPPDSRRHQLARALRDAVVRGDRRPGERIVERDIAARTDISRGPLREALRQLEQEGLIVSVPYQGTCAAGISQREIDEMLILIRLVLELFAFAAAVHTLTAEDHATPTSACTSAWSPAPATSACRCGSRSRPGSARTSTATASAMPRWTSWSTSTRTCSRPCAPAGSPPSRPSWSTTSSSPGGLDERHDAE
jgi:hypothetical protein